MEAINWYRTPLDKDLLKELTRRRNLPGLLHAGSFVLLFAVGTYFSWLLFARSRWIPMVIIAYAYCAFVTFMGIHAAAHELSHRTSFKTRWLNDIFLYLFCFLTWNNPVHFRASHLLHHQNTVHTGRDKEVVLAPISLGRNYWNMNFHIEHHMYAAVPFHNLRKLHESLAYDTPNPPRGYLAGVRRILRIQQQQRIDPSYCFVPELAPTASPPWENR